jgi:2-hydroxymuconate-semialdehyde hydrolase
VTAPIATSDLAVGEYTFRVNQTGKPGAEPIVWLHGSGPGATALTNWEEIIGELGDEYHNIAPDIIGFGDSTHPDPPPAGLAEFTQLRVNTILGLLDALDLDKVTLVGNSMGGIISMRLCAQAPGRVERLVLLGTGGAPDLLTPELLKLITFYDDPTVEAMAELMTCFVYDPAFFNGTLDEIAAARMPRASRPDVERSHRATFTLGEPLALSDAVLAAIAQPTLIVHGREDRVMPVAASYHFAARIPNAELHVFPKTGHWLQLEQPKRFANLLRAFLRDEV